MSAFGSDDFRLSVAGAVDDAAVRAAVPRPAPHDQRGAAHTRARRLKRQRSHAPAHRPAHVLHPDYMESGDGDRDGGQHEKPRLRPARADELFDLSL